MAHTPGPWIVREPEDDELYEVYAEDGGDLICYPVYTRNQRDNIHLIAAAPDLLEALVAMREAFTSNGTDSQHDACRMADAAILKARSE